MSSDHQGDELLTVDEAARFCRVGRTFFFGLIKSQKVLSFRLGGRRRIWRSDLIEYLDNQTVARDPA
jgi:excisionase family DNA binding protein